jgi:hypothetical protein
LAEIAVLTPPSAASTLEDELESWLELALSVPRRLSTLEEELTRVREEA